MLVDNAPVLLWAACVVNRRYFFNAGWVRYTGRTSEQEQGDGWLEGVHPDDRDRCVAVSKTMAKTPDAFRIAYRLRKHDGAYGWVSERAVPQYLADGTFAGFIGSCTELDESAEAQRRAGNGLPNHDLNDELAAANEELAAINEELRAVNEELLTANEDLAESEYLTRSIIANAPFPIAVYTGRDMRIVEANQSIIDVWGKGSDVIGKRYAELLPELAGQHIYEQLDAVYTTGIPFHARNQRVDLAIEGNLKRFYFNYSFTPLRNRMGNIYGVMNTAADVTDVVMSKFEIEKAYEQSRLSREAAGLGLFDLDLATGRLEWDNRCRELFAVAHDGDVVYERDFVDSLYPDDRDRVLAAIRDAQDRNKTNGDYDIEYRVVGKADQRLRWIKANGQAYFDGDGNPFRFIGTVQDITEKKHDEIRQRENVERKARLGAIVETTDDIIISKTLQGIITSWNRAAQRMFGYTAEEAIGQHISLIIPSQRLHEEELIIGEILKGNKVDHFETIRIGKDGQEIPVSITVSPLIDDHGNIIGASKIARDISVQLAAQEATNRYTERLEIINSIVASISEDLDLDNIVQKVIDSTTVLTGAKFGAFFYNEVGEAGQSEMSYALSGTRKEAFAQTVLARNVALAHSLFSDGVVRLDGTTEGGRQGNVFSRHGVGGDSSPVPVASFLAVPVVSRLGEVIGGLVFGHPERARFTIYHEQLVVSIAAQAAIGLDNAKLYAEVKALNDKKDEFIGLASHELKTPLTSVYAYLQLLADRPVGDRSKFFIEKALRQAKKLNNLVNDLLDVSKIEAGKLQLKSEQFDLRKLVEDTVELIAHTQGGHRVVFEPSAEPPLIVYSDAQRIEQVIINLLTNAIKYSPGTSEVRVTLECTPTECEIGVQDFGRGIPAAELPLVFTRFYRIADGGPNVSGLGIGLYLSNEIVTRLGGRLWAESELGAGSTFWFTIPTGKQPPGS